MLGFCREGGGLRALPWLLLATAFAAPRAAGAQPEHEIGDLLAAVRNSRCNFERNGTIFSGSQAAEHLATKYRSIARGSSASAEGFIESAGTASSISGSPYRVHCAGEPAFTSNEWLMSELRRIRLMKTKAGADRAQ